MFELATGRRLFNPEVVDDISRDVVHLAQMTQRTNQDHDTVALKRYEELPDLTGKKIHLKSSNLFTLIRHV